MLPSSTRGIVVACRSQDLDHGGTEIDQVRGGDEEEEIRKGGGRYTRKIPSVYMGWSLLWNGFIPRCCTRGGGFLNDLMFFQGMGTFVMRRG